MKGRINRLLDVDSYKSRFYGTSFSDLCGMTKPAGKSRPATTAPRRFFALHDVPALAFRSNRRALDVYIRSQKDYWTVLDAIAEREDKASPTRQAANAMTRRLINVILRNRETMIRQWMEDMATNPSTFEYHRSTDRLLYGICDKIMSQIALWLGNAYDSNRLKRFYTKLGRERRQAGVKISGV